VGLPKAKELIFSGRKVDAEEALNLGIADRLTGPDRLLADARAWAAEFAGSSRTALALGKAILNRSFEMSAEDVLREGSAAQGICYTSREHRESVIDFLNKIPERK
jgi:enoyl-CoA hydratase/carnithine racemase